MGFLNTDSMPRLVEKLSDGDNIKITGNSKGNRVGTVVKKIVEKADDVTKAIEQEVVNNTHSFKVGTGNVDVSSDVQDGFGEVGIKGVTYQNCLKFTDDINFNLNLENWNIRVISSDRILVKPNTVYTMIIYVSNVTVSHNELLWVGDVSGNKNSITDEIIRKNVTMGINTFKFTTNSNPEDKAIRFQGSKFVEGVLTFKPLLLEGDHTNNPNLPSCFDGIVGVGDKSKNLFNGKLEEGQLDTTTGLPIASKDRCRSVDYIEVEKNTEYRIQINNTQSNAPWTTVFLYDSNKNYINFAQDSHGGSNLTFNTGEAKYIKFKLNVKASSVTKAQVSKGSSDISYEPYYEGNKIEILSNGKNLWNGKMYSGWGGASPTMDELGSRDNVITDFIRVARNKNCFINKAGFAYAWLYDLNKNLIDAYHGNINAFVNGVPIKNADYIILGRSLGSSQINKEEYMDTIISYNKNDSFIESKSDKTQILLDEPLMRLPNGVCDEITRDGKLIRRVGKVVLDGSEKWKVDLCLDKENKYFSAILDAKLMVNSYYENVKMASLLVDNPYTVTDKICISVYPQDGIVARVQHPSLDKTTPNSIKEWLSQNPVTIYYQLETPIITDIVPPTLRIFKDGHITFDTLVAPESSHLVQLNKSGQIQNAIKESQSLDNRINVLENNYDNLMLSTISRLNDLELNYTLK